MCRYRHGLPLCRAGGWRRPTLGSFQWSASASVEPGATFAEFAVASNPVAVSGTFDSPNAEVRVAGGGVVLQGYRVDHTERIPCCHRLSGQPGATGLDIPRTELAPA